MHVAKHVGRDLITEKNVWDKFPLVVTGVQLFLAVGAIPHLESSMKRTWFYGTGQGSKPTFYFIWQSVPHADKFFESLCFFTSSYCGKTKDQGPKIF